MSEVKRYQADWHGMFLDLPGRRMGAEERLVVLASDFDRVTADLVSANAAKEAYARNAIDLRKRVDALQQRLTAADERIDQLTSSMLAETVCRGSAVMGTACGKCARCAALCRAEACCISKTGLRAD